MRAARASAWSESPPSRIGGCGALDGAGREVHRVEVEVTTVVLGLLLRPQRPQHLDALLDPREPSLGLEAERGELLRQPSRADAEDRPPARQHVEAT